MKRAIQIICLLLLFGSFTASLGAAGKTGLQLASNGGTAVINWTEGVLSAVGSGVPPEAYYGNERGREYALAAAVENARSKLMAAVKEIAIDAGGTVGDLIENSRVDQAAIEIHDRFEAKQNVDDFLGQKFSKGDSFELNLCGVYKLEGNKIKEITIYQK